MFCCSPLIEMCCMWLCPSLKATLENVVRDISKNFWHQSPGLSWHNETCHRNSGSQQITQTCRCARPKQKTITFTVLALWFGSYLWKRTENLVSEYYYVGKTFLKKEIDEIILINLLMIYDSWLMHHDQESALALDPRPPPAHPLLAMNHRNSWEIIGIHRKS